MVVVPPPVIAFDWLLPGVAWNGEAWRGAAWFGVAWLGGATLSTLAFSLTCYFPRWCGGLWLLQLPSPFRSEHSLGSSRKFTSDANGV